MWAEMSWNAYETKIKCAARHYTCIYKFSKNKMVEKWFCFPISRLLFNFIDVWTCVHCARYTRYTRSIMSVTLLTIFAVFFIVAIVTVVYGIANHWFLDALTVLTTELFRCTWFCKWIETTTKLVSSMLK